MNDAMNDTTDAAAESACIRIVHASAAANDRRDWAALAALYTVDGELVRPSGQVVTGRDAIEAAYRSGPADRRTRHVCTNTLVAMTSATTASATTSVLLFTWTEPEAGSDDAADLPAAKGPAIGEFADELVLTDDGWRLASRRASLSARAG